MSIPASDRDQLLDRLALREACLEFLYEECALLDDRDLHGWLDLLTEDVTYEMPIRITRERGTPEFSRDSFFFKEDFKSLQARIARFDTEHAWAENPPSRTRRYVSNVRLVGDDGKRDDEVAIRNNLLLYRAQGDTIEYDLLPAERHDVLRWVDDDLRLASRRILFDQTILDSKNLSIFL